MSRFLAPPPERQLEPGPTAPPHEVIVCDDGSTDDLEGALAPYRDRIVLVHKENGGGASALNAAAAGASGDFLVVLDSDDAYLPTRLEGIGGWDESIPIAYDWDCWLRLVLDGCAVGIVDEPLVRYRLRHGSLASRRAAAPRAPGVVLEKARAPPPPPPTER